MRRKYLKADLARDLGVDRSLVTRYARRGMPTRSLAAAEEWRAAHLDPLLVKRPAEDPDDLDELRFALVRKLAHLAELDPAAWLEELRSVVRELPPELWDRVELSQGTWEALIGARVLEALRRDGDAPDAESAAPVTPEHAFVCRNIVFLLATGRYHLDETPAKMERVNGRDHDA